MAEGGGGRRERKALSFFRFPLPPFPPKTPDTQSKRVLFRLINVTCLNKAFTAIDFFDKIRLLS